jgi:Tfp pilus assembly protein PilF
MGSATSHMDLRKVFARLVQFAFTQSKHGLQAKIRLAEAYIALGDAAKANDAVEDALKRDKSFIKTQVFKSLQQKLSSLAPA